MNRTLKISLVAAAFFGGVVASLAMSQPEGAPSAGMPDMSKMSKKDLSAMMEQESGPKEAHRALEAMIGKFDIESRMNMGPMMPALTSKSTGENQWILGKRFVQATAKHTPDEELKVESLSLFGYDTRKSKYTWVGFDTFGTYSVSAEGDYDKDKKAFTLMGENDEPAMGGKTPFKVTYNVADPDKHTMAIAFKFPGSEDWMTIAEATYTRRK